MTAVNNALRSIINGEKDFCCLCMSTIHDKPIGLDDEIVVNINNYEHEIVVSEVLNSLFDEQMCSYISTFDTLCDQCISSALSSYKFKISSERNATYLTNVFDGIANNFEYATNELYDAKSLYVSLNLEDFTSKQYYDTKKISTTRAALRRYRTLDNTPKTNVEDLILKAIKKEEDDEKGERRKRKKHKVDIPTRDMLWDKNNPDLFRCKECFKDYPTVWNLRNHFIRVHAPKVFRCPECPRSYGSAAFLEAHKFESHCTVVCSECGKTFYNRHTLKMHEMGHHLSLVCQDCGRVYKNKGTFKKHIELNVCGQESRAHPSEAKFTCDYCGKKYTQKVSLRVHIQYEHGNYKAHICEWCGKKFWAQSRLKAHIVKHTREKNFPCSTCGRKFVSKESLLYHTRTHTGEKPYKCPHCDSRFLSASRRSDHVKRQHLGATLECDICHSKFNSRTFLIKHKKSHAKPSDSTLNFTYKALESKEVKLNYRDQMKTLLKTEPETKSNLWQMDVVKVVGDSIPGLQKIIEASEANLNQLTRQVYHDEDSQQSEDGKVYLEVSDDTEDYIKILGV
ncbi:zinc finger protein 2-like [Helicoverpa zea]|uniref:zinc finger protein 2-like n=1 Tax=Helicoverpa zea TaxID=7113 RepID=UPI001F58B8A4|nr:zinc finger protein 2-like [Helicoverpa zea]